MLSQLLLLKARSRCALGLPAALLTALLPTLPVRLRLLWLLLMGSSALLQAGLRSALTRVRAELVDAVGIGVESARCRRVQGEAFRVLGLRRVVVHLLVEEVVHKVKLVGALADVALASGLADEVDLVEALAVGTDPGVLHAGGAVVEDGAVNRVVGVVARGTRVALELGDGE